ncbi:TRAP transporter permease [Tepidibacillus sp. HK-1]|uniref:TRAP transporter permease n=1 Tax=Tepidibacillus sp. HK-1 TaxID=1883407 RepID=UPI0008529144|nr:TRAP transporter permease [Tepidibacillus sp. HK-1]GBF12164.1 sialic acid TRAP transporter permease protein SiaT [Tepidibacillus sp. HK-1]
MSHDIQHLSQEEVHQLLTKYDRESAFYQYKGLMKWIVTILAISFSIFQVYASLTGNLPSQLLITIHLAFGLSLIYILFPTKKYIKLDFPILNIFVKILDIILPILGASVGLYWVYEYDGLVMRAGNYNKLDFIIGLLAVLLVLEASRRVVGIPITLIAALFLIYAKFGNYFPGFLAFRGLSWERIISHMYFTLNGILGTPLWVSAKFIFLFLLFGAFLEKTGVGQYFNDLALLIAGRRVGGPAKVAVFSSALQGTISGSSVANVVTSGSFTIPMMRKLGYRPEFAGAVEAAASTGGQIMPPIMGAAAFLMAEFIGLSYWEIAKAAAIPAILYFAGIWIMVHFEAKRTGLRGLTKEELPDKKEILKKLYLLIPLFVIIGFLMMGRSPIFSAISGIVSVIIVGLIGMLLGHNNMKIKDLFLALEDGAKSALGVVAATAAAGMIVGTVTLTGLGLKFANGLIDLAGGILIPTLILTMISSIILGMGSPTTANYIITSTIAAPAIITLGKPALAAHMFTFYFGIVADITPPVALAAFAASGIAGGKPIRTGAEATRLAIAAFIIPYIFVLSPELLLIDTNFWKTLLIITTASIGMLGISAGLMGYWLRHLNWLERILAIPAGLLLIVPGIWTDTVGLGTLAILLVIQYLTRNKDIKKGRLGTSS